MQDLKMYIAVIDEFPDHMVPTLVAHGVLSAHQQWFLTMMSEPQTTYREWLKYSFKKVVLRVNQKEFDKIKALQFVHLAHENNTLDGKPSCAVVCPRMEIPNVLKFAKLWKPKETT